MLDRSTSAEIGEEILKSFKCFDIPVEKIGAVCTDGGSNVKKACRDLFGSEKHLICTCHIMDNIIKESLKALKGLDQPISALKRLVQFFKQSYVAANKLRQVQMEVLDIKLSQCKMLLQSVPTRWNSLLRAIKRFSELYPFVKKIIEEVPDIQKNAPEISEENVETLEQVALLLEQFDSMTKKFSSNSSLVSNTVNLDLEFLRKHVEAEDISNSVANELKGKLLPEFTKRFAETKSSTLLAAANILDPRFELFY